MSRELSPPPEISPGRYIEKVSLLTGEVIEDGIEPHHLLVRSHRDYHLVDMQARRFMSRVVATTGSEEQARRRMKEFRRLGHKTSKFLARITGQDPDRVARALFGLKQREYYFRYRKPSHSRREIEEIQGRLRKEGARRLAAATGSGVRVLLTGGTGFIGQEILWQAAHDDAIAEVVVLIRPKSVRTGGRTEKLSAEERGQRLLDQLWLDRPEQRAKFRFVTGDVELPDLGISADEKAELARGLTHVVHCAASVAFDAPYDESYRANVHGTLNALELSAGLQATAGSPFVTHVAVETSYIHGRQVRKLAREDEVVFPRNFYNNYYELTKAIASIESERFMLDRGLRVVQLCPAIVIGEAATGNNRGDTKVVNAPVNVFGRAHEALSDPQGKWFERTRAAVIARMACVFPGDPSAELNLIPVDWVVRGVLAALTRPAAIGARIHLATDNRLTSEQIRHAVQEEVGVEVRLAEPTLHRNLTLPVLSKVLNRFGQGRLANALSKLGTIFGGYSEWGQPVHEVGRDVSILGLPAERPVTEHAFRMLCRHNRWVQEFGKIRDPEEISRRERVWRDFVRALEEQTSGPAGALEAEKFQQAVVEGLDLEHWRLEGELAEIAAGRAAGSAERGGSGADGGAADGGAADGGGADGGAADGDPVAREDGAGRDQPGRRAAEAF
jgi:nucleoside-diphosphate-sugar epimerase